MQRIIRSFQSDGLPVRAADHSLLEQRSTDRIFIGSRADRIESEGGAAVVMGALSPRTRNAQVDMFQSGEVLLQLSFELLLHGAH